MTNAHLTHETSINPIVNAYQGILNKKLTNLLEKHKYFGSSFDYFYLYATDLSKLKCKVQELDLEVYHHSGSSKEILVIDKKLSVIKLNFIEQVIINKFPAYKMSYNAISINADENLELVKIINKMKVTPPNNLKIKKIFVSGGKVASDEILVDYSPDVNPLAYPYIKDINTYFDNYFHSDVSVLIIKGPPGTGKSSLLRALSAKYNDPTKHIYFTSSSDVIQQDEVFHEYTKSDSSMFIFEDMDFHLTSRNEGNTAMYSLLSTSDGFIKNKESNKKLIFTTNIPNRTEFDEALIREGRCYGIIDFRPLTCDESKAFLESINRDSSWLVEGESYSLAQLYHPNKPVA